MGTQEEPVLIRVDTAEPWEFPIPEGTTRIGRSRESDICLEDSAVSRFHCYLLREGRSIRIFDGESKNPARVNGKVVTGQRLGDGSAIKVGRCEFLYQAARSAPGGETAGSPPAARQAARFSPPPRKRTGARAREPSVAAVLVLVAAAGGALWFFLGILPGLGKKSAGPAGQAARVDPPRAALERRIGELQLAQEAYRKESASAAALTRIEELSGQIAALTAELERGRAREAAGSPPPAPAAGPRADGSPSSRAGTLMHPAIGLPHPEGPVTPARDPADARTVVVEARPRLADRDVRGCVERLKRLLDDYATHTIVAATLEPDLDRLMTAAGKLAGEGIHEVHEHARRLLRTTDASIEENGRRKETLAARARTAARSRAEEPKTKDEYSYGKKVSADLERDQRQLELFDTAVGIHRKHREVLLALRKAVLDAVGRTSDPAALGYLRLRFAGSDDEEFCLAVVRAVEAARSRDSMPALWRKLAGAGPGPLRDAIRKTLAALAGVDLGERPGPWAEWWEKEKPGVSPLPRGGN